MKKLLVTFLFSLCMILPAWSATDDQTNDVTYNGIVDFQKKAYSEDVHTNINVYCSKTQSIGKHPNSDNTVSITCPKGEGLIVNHVGYQDQEFTANQLKANNYFFEALLVPSAVAVDDVVVTDCGPNISKGASKQHWDDKLQKCVPDECYEPAYVLNTTSNPPECEFANADCINSLDNQKGVQSAIWELNENGESICDIKDCKKPYYDLVEDDKGIGEAYCFDTRETNKNCLDTLPNKTGVKLAEWEDNDEKDDKICKIKSCITPQYELRDGLCADKTGETCKDENNNRGEYGMFNGEFTCVLSECNDVSQKVDEKTNTCKSYIGDKCTPTHNDNVKSAIWENRGGIPMCVIKDCKSKYRPNKAGDKCELIPKDCSDADKKTVLAMEGVAEAGLNEKEECVPTDCKCGYNLNNNKCVKWQDEPCDKNPTGATKAIKDCDANGKPYCQIKNCDEDNYTPIKEGTKIIKCDSKRGEDCKSTLSAEQQKIVKVAEYKKDGNKMQCIVKKCINDDYVIEKNMCVYNEGKDCTKEIRHAKAAKWVKVGTELVCQVTDGCEDGYKENDDKTKCIAKLKKCNSEDEKKLKDSGHALDTGIKAGTMPEKCVPTECECGYDLQNDQCVALAADRPCDAKNSLPDGAKSGVLACKNKRKEYCQITACNDGYDHDKSKNTCDEQDAKKRCEKAGGTWDASAKKCNGAKCPKGKDWNDKLNKCFDEVIKKRSDEEIKKLEENAQAMKDKEQSTANKMLGGATMAATGIGGMMLAQSLAEQKADQEAEVDMKAYLETFVCKYADGKSFKGGTENIELPGGNDLLPLYTEYVNLANDLKVRKEALGMRPGIESEKILDNATSGLYDDVALGKTGGAYASLARALQDPEGEDAKMWAAQKDKTKKNLIAGASVAGIGAVGGIVGNALINGKNSAKENSDKIKADFKGAAKDITNAAKDITTATPPQRKCDDYTNVDGGTYPNCTCLHEDERFFSDNPDGCVACQKGQKYDDKNNCVPDNDDTKNCELTNNMYKKPNKCECVDNATETKNVCACNPDSHDPNNEGKCIKKDKAIINAESKSKENKLVSLEFSADVLFDTGKAVLNAKAEAAFKQIAEVIEKHEDIFDNDSNVFEITIFGHTDRQPFNSGNSTVQNQKLSEKRAQAVKDVLIKNSPILMKNKHYITIIGGGSAQCTADVYPNANEPKCRKVELTIWAPWATTRDKATGADGFVQTVSNLLKDGNIMNGSNITSAGGGIDLKSLIGN